MSDVRPGGTNEGSGSTELAKSWHEMPGKTPKADPAKEPLATGESIPRIVDDAAAKNGRPRTDFEVEEIRAVRKVTEFVD